MVLLFGLREVALGLRVTMPCHLFLAIQGPFQSVVLGGQNGGPAVQLCGPLKAGQRRAAWLPEAGGHVACIGPAPCGCSVGLLLHRTAE